MANDKTGICDLPNELLLKIFAMLDDYGGHTSGLRTLSKESECHSPPIRIALVCKRWLPLAQQLFYNNIQIRNMNRIAYLYETFSSTTLPLSVRHLSIDLPYGTAAKLELPIAISQATASQISASAREADSDSDASTSLRPCKKQSRLPPSAQEQLRSVFQSCSRLLSLEISGISPLVLFSASSRDSSSLHHLHQLRLSTLANLTLKCGGESPVLTSTTLRDALLALTGLSALTVKGYVSDPTSPLSFTPTRTITGSPARPLPSRARTLLKLESISIIESAMSPDDLASLVKQVRPGCITHLHIEDHYDGIDAAQRRREGKYAGPTVAGLSREQVGEPLRESLTYLRVTLNNHPHVPISNRPSPLAPGHNRRSLTHPSPPYILDRFISTIKNLQTLDVGGTLVSSGLILAPFGSTFEPCLLPHSVRRLTIRGCPALTPSVVLAFLNQLAATRQRDSNRHGVSEIATSQLQELTVSGGGESGWKDPMKLWKVQQACWSVNIHWVQPR
ncbi:uncharacterized protein JCM15063_003669 [Sporobolomyces koalae]|uniref:uncharacterized protein n=1 Tax=Sporobolomyces koalae TaxID=500713 RepID=UPI0031786E32